MNADQVQSSHKVRIEFSLPEATIGWALHNATATEMVAVRSAALLSPDDAFDVQETLEKLNAGLLDKIPGLPARSQIDNLLIVIKRDLTAVAYVNEPQARAKVRVARAVEKGQPVRNEDIAEVVEVEVDVEVPDDAAIVAVRSFGWRRSLYFDFGPLAPEPQGRIGPLRQVLALQLAMLWGLQREPKTPLRTRVDQMADGYQRLRSLLDSRCEEESLYQELLEDHPWMLGVGMYRSVQRHGRFDDQNIPDFTGRRAADETDDIIELKQPFLPYFKRNGEFAVDFHTAWAQAERYLTFARDHRGYLREAKGMRFETPKVLLLAGRSWTEAEAKLVRMKELSNPAIRVMTYEQLINQAQTILAVMRTASTEQVPLPKRPPKPAQNNSPTKPSSKPPKKSPAKRSSQSAKARPAHGKKRSANMQKAAPANAKKSRANSKKSAVNAGKPPSTPAKKSPASAANPPAKPAN
jgi:hypothetical protein